LFIVVWAIIYSVCAFMSLYKLGAYFSIFMICLHGVEPFFIFSLSIRTVEELQAAYESEQRVGMF